MDLVKSSGIPSFHLGDHELFSSKAKMFFVTSQFEVEDGFQDKVKKAFQGRTHLVDKAEGFIRMDVVSPVENPLEFMLITVWEDRGSFEEWHKNHAYDESHSGIPHGLKLNPAKTKIRLYEHIAS